MNEATLQILARRRAAGREQAEHRIATVCGIIDILIESGRVLVSSLVSRWQSHLCASALRWLGVIGLSDWSRAEVEVA
jgi:hypothetical protein